MNLDKRVERNVLVLRLSGELMGGSDAEIFRQTIDQAIQDENVNVVVDLSKVNWMNSSGLGMLVSALTTLRSSGGDLVLASLSERVRRPIVITKLDTVFREFDTSDQAIKSYQ